MTKITIKDAIVMIGHADPETKIAGWLAIGETVTEARKRFGITKGRCNEASKNYQEWLVKSGIKPAISVCSANEAARLFSRKKDLDNRRRSSKIPLTWTNPKELLRALDDVEAGRDPAKHKTRKHTKDVDKDGQVKLWSDGRPGAFFSEGLAFGNMLGRLPNMTKSDQLKAVGAFFGDSSHMVKTARQADGSIRVYSVATKDSPVDRAKFDITITFHKGVE